MAYTWMCIVDFGGCEVFSLGNWNSIELKVELDIYQKEIFILDKGV